MPLGSTAPDLALLVDLPLFRFVPAESIQGILQECTILDLPKGAILWSSGAQDRNLYILLSGAVSFYFGIGDDYPTEVREKGKIVGEILFGNMDQAPATVVAATKSRLLVMDEFLIWSLAQVSHAAACNILGILLHRLSYPESAFSEQHDQGRLYHQAGAIDALTGLHSRNWMDKAVERQLNRNSHTGKNLSIILLDIDLFKDFIEKHGRLCGDWAIHTIAQSLREYLRPTEMVARYGGDRFVLLLTDVELAEARSIADRLRNVVMRTVIVMPDGRVIPSLTVSAGVVQALPGQSATTLMAKAADALRSAKQAGRNIVAAELPTDQCPTLP